MDPLPEQTIPRVNHQIGREGNGLDGDRKEQKHVNICMHNKYITFNTRLSLLVYVSLSLSIYIYIQCDIALTRSIFSWFLTKDTP